MRTAAATHDAWVPATGSVALALGAAIAVQVAAAIGPLPGAPVELVWITGWMLAAWAAIAAAAAVVVLGRRAVAGAAAAPALPSLLLVVLAVAVLALTFAMHPPFGSGSAIG